MRHSDDEQDIVLRLELLPLRRLWPGIERDLASMGVRRLADLQGREPEQLCTTYAALIQRPADDVLLDVFTALVAFAETGRPQPWWLFTRQRAAAAYRASALPGTRQALSSTRG